MDWFFGYMRWAAKVLNPFSTSSHRRMRQLQRLGRLLGRRALLLILILGAPLNTLAGIHVGLRAHRA